MASTRSFDETVRARAARDPAFREALLTEAVERLLAGEIAVGKAVLRDLIDATIGFDRLAEDVGEVPADLERMLAPEGEPTASNLFAVLGRLQHAAGVRLHVAAG